MPINHLSKIYLNMERKQRIKELLKRKLPEKECSAVHPKGKENMTNKKTNAMIPTADTTIITNSTNEKMIVQRSTATTNTINKQDKTTTEFCIVCGKNLSYCSLNTRELHINACLDNKIEIETNSISVKKFDAKQSENKEQHSLFAIAMVCPCCNITFKAKTEKGKLSSSIIPRPGKTSPHIGHKEKKLTNYFNPISNDKDKLSKTDSISKENPKLSFVVSRSYNVSILDHDDDDFQSSIVFKARSTIEKSDKRKKEIDDDDDDFQVGVALSRSILPLSQKRKKVKYNLDTTPILSCADAIKKAKERANIMYFNRPTMSEISKSLPPAPKFPKSEVGEKYARQNYNEIGGRPNRKRHPYTLWEIQAFGGDDNPLTRDDYITDMIWHYHKNMDD
ncbi:hypothetical protein C1646_683989, partial [Rhizophagus diaphanus]